MTNKGDTWRFEPDGQKQKVGKKLPSHRFMIHRIRINASDPLRARSRSRPFVLHSAADPNDRLHALGAAVEHKSHPATRKQTLRSKQIHHRLNNFDQLGMSQNPLKSKRDLCYQVSHCKIKSL